MNLFNQLLEEKINNRQKQKIDFCSSYYPLNLLTLNLNDKKINNNYLFECSYRILFDLKRKLILET